MITSTSSSSNCCNNISSSIISIAKAALRSFESALENVNQIHRVDIFLNMQSIIQCSLH